MCCGSRRSAWRSSYAPTPATRSQPQDRTVPAGAEPAERPTAQALAARAEFPSVRLAYAESSPIRVRGPVTGRPYDFSGSQPSQDVDVRDAAVFARNSLFRQSAP